ncbi:GNAT family N-acetyltransferase [Actinophytocola oryzae]|uniref:Ribosomal-protein-alanine N-acetyltransferase n=1 Tax=Actinophytocola oryzae TaxID=502181 RepID=A0A4R7VT47_9PSEU|nr:GNAT family N-acetyltransferase [Actinophytocola oryzae]TDV52387.1 ribosomal-protein-alanine N-acetyltransferase [Actinophytocola oryzae]
MLERLTRAHAPALLDFERENRAYFAAAVTDRGDDYFAHFTDRHEALLSEQATGACHFHVVVVDGEILGRVNLVDVADGTAELGFRMAKKATGQGLATAAVRAVSTLAATKYGLTRLRAAARIDNLGSRTVLTRTGFTPTGEERVLGDKPGVCYVLDLTTRS